MQIVAGLKASESVDKNVVLIMPSYIAAAFRDVPRFKWAERNESLSSDREDRNKHGGWSGILTARSGGGRGEEQQKKGL